MSNDRIFRLAANPLLLTTLLLVKRWVGQLPTRRSVLYGKAIEVLLMTWNVEAHRPLDPDEIIPQLAFVAYTMIQNGAQKISRKGLTRALVEAREQMPEILGYAKVSVSELIERVEYRSSLMMLSGHIMSKTERSSHSMSFRHLTFQEYLTARAISDGYYPNRDDRDTPLELLRGHIEDERWREVIPLVAVLSGRRSEALVRHLSELCQDIPPDYTPRRDDRWRVARIALEQCIEDEVQASPAVIRGALSAIARTRYLTVPIAQGMAVARGKYGALFREVAWDGYLNSGEQLFNFGGSVSEAEIAARIPDGRVVLDQKVTQEIVALCGHQDKKRDAQVL